MTDQTRIIGLSCSADQPPGKASILEGHDKDRDIGAELLRRDRLALSPDGSRRAIVRKFRTNPGALRIG
jgi:hypothetical protein